MDTGRAEGSKESAKINLYISSPPSFLIFHLLDDMKDPGEHRHVNPEGVCARVKLIIELRLA